MKKIGAGARVRGTGTRVGSRPRARVLGIGTK
jgi:hypothetical protein